MKILISFIFVVVYCFHNSHATGAVVIVGSQLQSKVETMRHEVTESSIVDVICHPQQMCISLSKDWLEKMWLVTDITQLGLGAPCNATMVQNLTHVSLCTEDGFLISCGTTYRVNDSHVIYSNNVTMQINQSENSQSDVAIQYNRWFPWSCIFPVRLLVGVHLLPQISPITQFLGRQTGLGQFQVVMLLYKDPEYTMAYDIPPHLTSKDRIRVQVKLMEGPTLAKLQVVHCWGTPDQLSMQNQFQYPLIENYCPKPTSADVSMMNNGVATYVRWESKVFKFINFTKVYLHCNVKVCFEGTVCEETCNSASTGMRRKRREAYVDNAIVSVGPISPGDEVLIAQASKLEIADVIRSFNDETNDEHEFSKQTKTFLGLPREVLYVTITLLVIVCVTFLVVGFVFVWKRRRSSKQSEIRNHLALPHRCDDDNQISMSVASSSQIYFP